ncbi:hypothetical protein SHLA_92c000210 [Shinella sp. DD12]|nr:hypothetical protein SHLA_92c000210 [Shinella sp. DD12]
MRNKKEKRLDVAQSTLSVLTKGGLGSIPFAGTFLSEAVGEVIGSKRISRIEDTLGKVVAELGRLAPNVTFEGMLADEENHELFQEAIISAAKKNSETRRGQIANLLAHGILDPRKESRCSLLRLQDALSDTEILILFRFCLSNRDLEDFKRLHDKSTRQEFVDINHRIVDEGLHFTDYHLSIRKLESAGLIERPFQAKSLEKFFERINDIREQYYQATNLGRLLCALLDPVNKAKYASPFASPEGFIAGLDVRSDLNE